MLNNIEKDEINLSDVIDLGANLVDKKNFLKTVWICLLKTQGKILKKYLLFNLEKFKYNVTKMAQEIEWNELQFLKT